MLTIKFNRKTYTFYLYGRFDLRIDITHEQWWIYVLPAITGSILSVFAVVLMFMYAMNNWLAFIVCACIAYIIAVVWITLTEIYYFDHNYPTLADGLNAAIKRSNQDATRNQ
jgi:hypothetical protein